MKRFVGFERGMGIGGWLTNYKRFNVLPRERRFDITVGDEEHFRSYVTERDVRYIAESGFDHVRVCFDQIVVMRNGKTLDEEIVGLLGNFFDWCKKYGLNVVLNLHKAIGNYCDIASEISLYDDEELRKNFVNLWVLLEKRFSAYPSVVFELLNEVTEDKNDGWNGLAEETVGAIRKINPVRKIVVGCKCWGDVNQLSSLRLFDDENVIYTFHFYAPFEYTHQKGVLQPATCYYNRDMEYPGDVEKYRDFQRVVNGVENAYPEYDKIDKKFIYDRLSPVKDFIKAHPDKIIWCGEFGNIRHVRPEWRIAWFRDVISFLKENEIPYSVWNYLSTPNDGNRFSLVDDDERKFLSEELKRTLLGDF